MSTHEYRRQVTEKIAAEKNRPAYDVLFDLVSAEKLDVGVVLLMMDEEDIRRIMQGLFR